MCQIQLQDSHCVISHTFYTIYILLYIYIIFSNIVGVLKTPKSKASSCHIKPQLYPESRHTVGLIWNVFLSTGFGQRKSSVNSAGHNTLEHLQREKAPTVVEDGNPPIRDSCSKANENAASLAFARCLGSGQHPAAPPSDSNYWSHPTSCTQLMKGETFYDKKTDKIRKQESRSLDRNPGYLVATWKHFQSEVWRIILLPTAWSGCVSLWFGTVWVRLACYSVDVISLFVWNCRQIASRINKSIALFEGPFMVVPVAFPHYSLGRNAKFYCSFNEESIQKCECLLLKHAFLAKQM